MKYSIRPIAFRPEWVEEFGDMQTAVFFQQIFYWSDKGKLSDGWVFKTIADFEFETTLSKDQQRRCRENLIRNGYIEVEKKKALFGESAGAPVLHFRIIKFPDNGFAGNPTMDLRETRQSSYTESTTESTTNTLQPVEDDGIAECESFSSEEYIRKMRENKSAHIRLIGSYFTERGVWFPDKKTAQDEVRRWTKDAAFLVKYGPDKVDKAWDIAKRKHPDLWNLSTVRKIIPEA